MKKYLLSLLLVTGLNVQAQTLPCTDFESAPLGPVPTGWTLTALGGTIASGAGPNGSTKYIRTTDQGGASYLSNTTQSYQNLGTNHLGCSISWDQRIFNDGDPGVLAINPRIYLYIGPGGPGVTTNWIRFTAIGTFMRETDGFWTHTSAPLVLTTGGVFPGVPGVWQWDAAPGLTAADFNNIMLNNTGIMFECDYTGASQAETIGFDNICVGDCPQPVDSTPCDANFTLQINYNSFYNPLSFVPQATVTASVNNFHPTSTYSYNWGDGTITTHPISKIYSPGPFANPCYTVCVTETTASGCICRSCVDFCLPTTSVVSRPCDDVVNPPEDPGGISGMKKTNPGLNGISSNDKVELYPNPTSSNFDIKFNLSDNEAVQIHILDMTGKLVYDYSSALLIKGSQTIKVNTGNLPSGLYQVRLKTSKGTTTEKLSVTK